LTRKRKRIWPPWWDWSLDVSDHAYDNMPVRGFTEVDLRRMMEHAIGYRPDIEEGRWRIRTMFKRQPWEVIVEPVPEKKVLVVVTAYDVS
jgi:hypothetical protein